MEVWLLLKQVSFIHAADLHLDSPFKGLSQTPSNLFKMIRESTFSALDELVQTAIHHQVDFVLLVGDLFDNEKQSIKAQIRLKQAFELLQQHQILVYLSYGNHDYIKGNKHPVTYPDNVTIFSQDTVDSIVYEKNGEAMAAIYGFSYVNRSVHANKTSEYEKQNESIPFHIAMLHGSVQSNTDHDVYAPFQVRDLSRKDFDYWALGHIHQREILKEDPPIVYPGNTQGRHRKETGAKGCYHVVLSHAKAELSFIPLQAFQINSLTINVSECKSVLEIEQKILDELTKQSFSVPQLIDIHLEGTGNQVVEWDKEGRIEEVIDLINESCIQKDHWIYLFRYSIHLKTTTINPEWYKGEHFISELLHEADNQTISSLVTELYQQKRARRFIERLTDEQEQQIKREAKELLIHELFKE